ncbi:MAG: cupin domain-containing protein [Myxococcota bacterium]
MELNADFDRRAVVHGAELDWRPSPMPGVERRMLDRIGAEVARATTIVRYAPGSAFSPHVHGGGEEFLVLEGVFSDEHGDFPAGSYVRNPPTSRHTPGSAPGTTILVKLWQFDPADRHAVRLRPDDAAFAEAEGRPGVEVRPLHADEFETVRLERWAPGAEVRLAPAGGLEVFVLEGGFEEAGESFAAHSWLRLPAGAALSAEAGPAGASVWVKSGHVDGAAERFQAAFAEVSGAAPAT